jgi:hypothetical protein
MSAGKHRRGGDGPWLEQVVLATGVGEWSAVRLVVSLLWIALMSGISASFMYEHRVLNQRGELVLAQVIRTNYDQRGPSFNAELQAPFLGVRVLVEGIHQRPATGDLIALEVDPFEPTRVRDPQSRRWSPWDFAFMALIPVGLVIAWARANRWLRARRPSSPTA